MEEGETAKPAEKSSADNAQVEREKDIEKRLEEGEKTNQEGVAPIINVDFEVSSFNRTKTKKTFILTSPS